MAQYIDKAALVAEIERRIKSILELIHPNGYDEAALQLYKGLLSFTNSLEVKEPTASDRGIAEEIITNLKRVEQDYHIDLTREMEWIRNKV